MSWLYWIYKWAGAVLFMVGFPLVRLFIQLSGRHQQNLAQRQGVYHFPRMPRPRVWLHAASVGEVGVATAIIAQIRERYPRSSLCLSTTTQQGLDRARKHYAGRGGFETRPHCFLAPLDYIGAVQRALATIKPDVLVCVETELWPNWLVSARRRGAAVVLVNGRISPRAFKTWSKLPALMRYVLPHVNAFSMISPGDAARIICLGAPVDRVQVKGNAKYDALTNQPDRDTVRQLASQLGLTGSETIWVAGSTRSGEEELLLGAYTRLRQQYDNLVLILAPRHIERIPEISRLVTRHKLNWRLRSDLQAAPARVILLDTLGELTSAYALAYMVFCGGSLVPRGGQNILEAAACGAPVLYGPFMADFITEKALLEQSGGGIPVADASELTEKLRELLANPAKAAANGRQGRQAVLQNRGAAARHAAVIGSVLP